MRRFVFAVLCSCVLVSLGFLVNAAKAGEYYGGGYYGHRHATSVWYSSSCCYRKIVRHERSVRYVRTDDGYRQGYYGRPYYRDGYYDRPYRSGSYYVAPRRYVDYGARYTTTGYSDGYDSYNSCSAHRIRVPDGRGGWVWGVRAGCY